MQQIIVPYGHTRQIGYVDDGIKIQTVDVPPSGKQYDLKNLIEKSMNNPIGCPHLEDMVTKRDKIAIVVNDQTRPGPNGLIMDAIISRLESAGIADGQISIVFATGSHRSPTAEEMIHIIGKKHCDRFSIVVHDCLDDESLAYIGDTPSGMPLYINRTVAEATFCIVTGLIAPHHCAGYSGGRKSIVPGVAGLKSLKVHHSFPVYQYEPAMGYIYGNPFHEIALDAARRVAVKFMVNAVQDPHKNYIEFVSGDLVRAHEEGVRICREACSINVSSRAEVIVASPGGFPRDIDLYQAQKALSVAETLCAPNCVFILCAECRDGFGEGNFHQWMVYCKSPEDIIDRYAKEGFNVGNNKAFNYARALMKGRVIIVTDRISEKALNEAKLEWAPNLQEALRTVMSSRRFETMTVIPNAVNFVTHIEGGQ